MVATLARLASIFARLLGVLVAELVTLVNATDVNVLVATLLEVEVEAFDKPLAVLVAAFVEDAGSLRVFVAALHKLLVDSRRRRFSARLFVELELFARLTVLFAKLAELFAKLLDILARILVAAFARLFVVMLVFELFVDTLTLLSKTLARQFVAASLVPRGRVDVLLQDESFIELRRSSSRD